MSVQRLLARLALAASPLLVAACSIVPLQLLASTRATPQPPIVLSRCGEAPDLLCLVTFGLEPPDAMLIVLRSSPGLPQSLEAVVTYQEKAVSYPCEFANDPQFVIRCTGPQLPLGSSMRIQVYTTEERTLLASGEFVLVALALPTVPIGGVEFPTASPLPTTRSTRTPRTPIPATAYPTLTGRAAQSPMPGVASTTPSPLISAVSRRTLMPGPVNRSSSP